MIAFHLFCMFWSLWISQEFGILVTTFYCWKRIVIENLLYRIWSEFLSTWQLEQWSWGVLIEAYYTVHDGFSKEDINYNWYNLSNWRTMCIDGKNQNIMELGLSKIVIIPHEE